jgi:hypothetical protein
LAVEFRVVTGGLRFGFLSVWAGLAGAVCRVAAPSGTKSPPHAVVSSFRLIFCYASQHGALVEYQPELPERSLLVSLLLHGLIVAVLLFDLPEPIAEAEPEEEVVAVTIVPPPEPEAAPEPEPEAAPEAEEPAPEPEAPNLKRRPNRSLNPSRLRKPRLFPPGRTVKAKAGPCRSRLCVRCSSSARKRPVLRSRWMAARRRRPNRINRKHQPPSPNRRPPRRFHPGTNPGTRTSPMTPQKKWPKSWLKRLWSSRRSRMPRRRPCLPRSPRRTRFWRGDAPGNLPDATGQAELALLPDDPADPAPSAPEPVVPDPVEIPPPASDTRAPSAAPADTAPAVDNGLPGVRALSSIVDTGHAVATTAMGALPREERGSRLCTTELREQLRRAPEPYRVELLPAYRLPGGTVLNVPNAAFRAGGAWYNLSFRCTVDRDALRVTDFTFKVGTAIPRQDWRARGFPEF